MIGDDSDLKPIVSSIMDLARTFRSSTASDYDTAYTNLQAAIYTALGARLSHGPTLEPHICYDHGPWVDSKVTRDEKYCHRCLVRLSFVDQRRCDPHIVYVPKEPR